MTPSTPGTPAKISISHWQPLSFQQPLDSLKRKPAINKIECLLGGGCGEGDQDGEGLAGGEGAGKKLTDREENQKKKCLSGSEPTSQMQERL